MTRAALLLLLSACATPRGAWTVTGGTPDEQAQALAIEAAAERVTPDAKGWLARGGAIFLRPNLVGDCPVPPELVPAGCSNPGAILVLWPHPRCPPGSDLTCSALAHEACHLGLEGGGGLLGGPVDTVTDERADACALLVNQEYLRSRQ